MKRSRQSVVPQWKAEDQVITALEQDDKGFYKSEGTIEFRLDKFSKFARDEEEEWSEPAYIRGLLWQINACFNDCDNDSDSDSSDSSQSNDDSGQSPSKYLSVYLTVMQVPLAKHGNAKLRIHCV